MFLLYKFPQFCQEDVKGWLMVVHHVASLKFDKFHPVHINPVFMDRIGGSEAGCCKVIDPAGKIDLEIDVLPHGPADMGRHIHIARPPALC